MTEKLSINSKLDKILKNQEKMIEMDRKILKEEEKIENLEEQELKHEISEEEALRNIESLQLELKEKIGSPITKISKQDLFKGFIGASIGIVSHFAFVKGVDLGGYMSIERATGLYIVAFLIIVIMLYFTGFRKVEKQLLLKFMPVRALILYSVSIMTIIIVYFLFGLVEFPLPFWELYTTVGASIILASMGAGTADLLGRTSE